MPGIFVRPDATHAMVLIVATFDVDADTPELLVQEKIYPEKIQAWLRQMAARGYTHRGGVYRFPKRYAAIETNDDGSVRLGAYEHREERRQKVARKMAAYFWRRAPVVTAESNVPERENDSW